MDIDEGVNGGEVTPHGLIECVLLHWLLDSFSDGSRLLDSMVGGLNDVCVDRLNRGLLDWSNG